jgi:hypothetical protein
VKRKVNDVVFSGQKAGRPLSNVAFLIMLRRMDETTSPFTASDLPGLGSRARATVGSRGRGSGTGATVTNKVEAAPRRTDLFENRRVLMREWGAFCGASWQPEKDQMAKRASPRRDKRKRQRKQAATERAKLMERINKSIIDLEAPVFLEAVHDKDQTALQRFDKLVPLLQKPDYFAKVQSFAKERFTEFLANDFDDDDKLVALYMLMAVKVRRFSGLDEPIRRAFTKANLDPEDPMHWRLLMRLLCWSVFPPPNPPGHPPEWNDVRYCKLLEAADKVKCDGKRSDFAISTKLTGYNEKPGTLREALRRARDPDCNKVLSYFFRPALESIQRSYMGRGRAWPPADLKYLLKRISELTFNEDMSSASQPRDMTLFQKSAFQLFNKLRENNHQRIVQTIRSNGFDAYPVYVFFRIRRANREKAVCDALSVVRDYDACLNIVEPVLEDDEMQFGLYVLTHTIPVDEEDPFAAIEDRRERDLKSLEDAVARYYCDRIAKGEIDLSEASRRH